MRAALATVALVAVAALACLLPRLAAAHAIGLSRGEYRAVANGVQAQMTFDRAELGALLEGSPGDAPEAAAVFALSSSRGVIERRIVQRVRIVDRGGLPCPGALLELGPSDQGGVALTAVYRCAGLPETTSAVIEFWDALTPGHRHLVLTEATSPNETGSPSSASAQQIVYARQPRFTLASLSPATTAPPSTAPPAAESPSLLGWLTLGIEHILGGYDHLLFLLALVIVMPVLKTLAATVSVFTLAHSITLALATLGVVAPPTSWVECAIALSIVYVGLENLTARASSPRFALVFGFGLIHGFGFAGALAELGLPVAAAPTALLSFNAGVELGQLAVLAVVFPLVQRLRRAAWFGPRAVPAFSLATALAGAVWFFERV